MEARSKQMLLSRHLRKKGIDVDKPEGYIKYKLKRWWRVKIKRMTKKEIKDELN